MIQCFNTDCPAYGQANTLPLRWHSNPHLCEVCHTPQLHPSLQELSQLIKQFITLPLPLLKHPLIPAKIKADANTSATLIQQNYRAYRQHQQSKKNIYDFHLSRTSGPDYPLSAANFGQRVSYIQPDSRHYIKNPLFDDLFSLVCIASYAEIAQLPPTFGLGYIRCEKSIFYFNQYTQEEVNYKFSPEQMSRFDIAMKVNELILNQPRKLSIQEIKQISGILKYPVPGIPSYYRTDNYHSLFSADMRERLLTSCAVPPEKRSSQQFIPFSILKTIPIEQFIKSRDRFSQLGYEGVYLPRDPEQTIGLLAIKRAGDEQVHTINLIRQSLIAPVGLSLSKWQSAVFFANDYSGNLKPPCIPYPCGSSDFLSSKIWFRLSQISANTSYPTHKLALSLVKLLKHLPDLNLSSEAIQRMSERLDLTLKFNAKNYVQFAQCVYIIIHEISLSLCKEKNPQKLQKYYASFEGKAMQFFRQTLDLTLSELKRSFFIASAANSGCHAHFMAVQLALKMKTLSGSLPIIKIIEPVYYELISAIKISRGPEYPIEDRDADIFAISAGPIVDGSELHPGVNINEFVQRVIINTKRKAPITIIVDTTSALYQNLKLTSAVKALVISGQLSLIFNESYQKFGLLHSDQASSGGMFGILSPLYFKEDDINQMKEAVYQDYIRIPDIRIGLYINTYCRDILESIKQTHFNNGSRLRVFSEKSRGELNEDILRHPEALQDAFFITWLPPKYQYDNFITIIAKIFESKDSFGHFNTSWNSVGGRIRISPSASDNIDCLIEGARIYLANEIFSNRIDPVTLLLIYAKKSESFAIHYQILFMALLHCIIDQFAPIKAEEEEQKHEAIGPPPIPERTLTEYFWNLLKSCRLLEGRDAYKEAFKYIDNRKKQEGRADAIALPPSAARP